MSGCREEHECNTPTWCKSKGRCLKKSCKYCTHGVWAEPYGMVCTRLIREKVNQEDPEPVEDHHTCGHFEREPGADDE